MYVRGMSTLRRAYVGTATYIGILLASGGPAEFRLRRAWPLHRALCELADDPRLSDDLKPPGPFTPDPDVGRRAPGVLAGIAQLVAGGLLIRASADSDRLIVVGDQFPDFCRLLLRCPEPARDTYRGVAARWASAETSSKNLRKATSGLPPTRTVNRGIPRQEIESLRRHEAEATV